jgi:hypothetical protein
LRSSSGKPAPPWSIFLASYFVFAFGRFPATRIDRTAMATIGAVMMFVFLNSLAAECH